MRRTSFSLRSRYSISCAIVTILRPCVRANSTRCGMRAIEPSSFITSQITPAGFRPARRARSTEPSVCPARRSTPPSRARSGKMWPGRERSCGSRFVVDRDPDGVGAVGGGDAGGDALARFDRDREGGAEGGGVVAVGHHHREPQFLEALLGEREADQSAPEARHEVDRFRRHALRGHAEVAFVLAVLVVGEDDHPAGADLGDAVFDRDDHVRPFRGNAARLEPQRGSRLGIHRCVPFQSDMPRSRCQRLASPRESARAAYRRLTGASTEAGGRARAGEVTEIVPEFAGAEGAESDDCPRPAGGRRR